MKYLRKRCLILALLVSILATVAHGALAKPPAGGTAPSTYAAWLKDPASLGFRPDRELFETVRGQLKAHYFESVADTRLLAGAAAEVERLLKEAGVSPRALKGIPRDSSMPERVVRAYAHKVDRGLLYYAMIRGLLGATGDPYNVLMTPREYRQLMEVMQSEAFGGIGIYIEIEKDRLTIVEPIEGTPASAAGLLAGDEIVAIDGHPTTGLSLEVATTRIRGPQDSTVVLTVRRKGMAGPRDYKITRGRIQVASVTHKMLASGVGLVRLRVFGERTGIELEEAIATLQAAGARALILDLRNNGGGYLNAATEVCSRFLEAGTVVTRVTDRRGARGDYRTRAEAHTSLPMVLLVNGYSASASEITAGCLKDYKRAVLVGTKTFGKGSVQQLYPLPSGAALKITVARFFTPKGEGINRVGVAPDVEVAMEPRLVGRADEDVQVRKALEYLRTQHVIE